MNDYRDTIISAENLDLTSVVRQLYGSSDLAGINIVELVHEYRRFLAVKVLHEDTGVPSSLSPSASVATVWRAHLLNPGHYIRCCNKLGVSIIDHDPEEDNISAREKTDRTKMLYQVVFNEEPPRQYWSQDTYQNVGEVEMERAMKIQLRQLNGVMLCIDATPATLVSEIKKPIEDRIAEGRQVALFYSGKQLDDGKTLKQYDMKNGSIVSYRICNYHNLAQSEE
jgi:hypothetical protein